MSVLALPPVMLQSMCTFRALNLPEDSDNGHSELSHVGR